MNVRERATGVEIIDRRRRTTWVELGEGWERSSGDTTVSIADYHAEETLRVTPSDNVSFPSAGCRIFDQSEEPVQLGSTRQISPSETVVIDAPVLTIARFPSGGSLSNTPTQIEITTNGDVVLGWCPPPDTPPSKIHIQGTDPQAVADGVSALSVSLPPVESPKRTWPNSRPSTSPSLSLEDGVPPSEIEQFHTDLRLTIPDDDALPHLFAAASLAHYVGADIVVKETDSAKLSGNGSAWIMGEEPAETDETASDWLRRVFYFDCLVRRAGPYGVQLHEADVLDLLLVSAAELYDEPMATRVDHYLSIDASAVEQFDDTLPVWPHAVHVAPEVSRLASLSMHVARLADVRLPEATRLETPGQRVEWANSQRVRGSKSDVSPRIVPAAETPVVGWDARGDPVGAYDVRGRPEVREKKGEIQVTVVKCGSETAAGAVERWRERESSLPLSVTTISRPTVARLREELQRSVDVFHLAAHHDSEGVECRDGSLSPADISRIRVGPQVVVANACDSLQWAETAVDRGAVAAVGTTGPVAAEVATEVGSHLAGMLSLGWTVERATDVVRRASVPGGYVVVGDGGHQVTGSDSILPPLISVDTDTETACLQMTGPLCIGTRVWDPLSPSCRRLPGTWSRDIDDNSLQLLSESVDSPIILDGSLTWPPYGI